METITVTPSAKTHLDTSTLKRGRHSGNGQKEDIPIRAKDGLLTDTLRLEAKDGNLLAMSKTEEAKPKKLAYLT